MFTINLGDGREAPSEARKKGAKRLEFLVFINNVSNTLTKISQDFNLPSGCFQNITRIFYKIYDNI